MFLNSGSDRVLALSADGIVVRDTGQMEGLNPGGGNFGPDGRYFGGSRSRSTVMAFAPALDAAGEHFLPAAIVRQMSGDRSAISPTARPSAGVLSLNANNGSRSPWTKAAYSERE